MTSALSQLCLFFSYFFPPQLSTKIYCGLIISSERSSSIIMSKKSRISWIDWSWPKFQLLSSYRPTGNIHFQQSPATQSKFIVSVFDHRIIEEFGTLALRPVPERSRFPAQQPETGMIKSEKCRAKTFNDKNISRVGKPKSRFFKRVEQWTLRKRIYFPIEADKKRFLLKRKWQHSEHVFVS